MKNKYSNIFLFLVILMITTGCEDGPYLTPQPAPEETPPPVVEPTPEPTPIPEPEPEPTPEPEPEPTPVVNPCDGMTQQVAEQGVQFSINRSVVFEGEEIRIQWNVSRTDPEAVVELWIGDQRLSANLSGTQTYKPASPVNVELTASICGKIVERKLPVKLVTWGTQNVPEVKSLIPMGNDLIAGGMNGSLYQWKAQNQTWSTLSSGNRISFIVNGVTSRDSTAVNTIAFFPEACPNFLFFGTEGGSLYRSVDDGVSVKDLSGSQERAVLNLFQGQFGPNTPRSPIRFVVQDSAEPQKLYVGHELGVVLMNDCKAVNLAQAAYANVPFFMNHHAKGAALFEDATYIATDRGLFESVNGAPWVRVEEVGLVIRWIKVSEGKLWVGTPGGVFNLQQGVWNQAYREFFDSMITSGFVSMKVQNNQLSLSRNNGTNWTFMRASHAGSLNLLNTSAWYLDDTTHLVSRFEFPMIPVLERRRDGGLR